MNPELKDQVREFWDRASCGEMYASGESEAAAYEAQRASRYELEPYLPEFARFADGGGRDVLEIGVGMGADHVEWARSGPRSLTGVDLTPRAVEHTRRRLALLGLQSTVRVDDAENLSFADESFDLVYSWGVLHHSPNTPKAIQEVQRVLRPGGIARVMIYHKYSIIGYVLWARYGLGTGRPWRTLEDVYAQHLESPGTKAYTVSQTRAMFARFKSAHVRSHLAFGDLLQGQVGQRHQSGLLRVAKAMWPRWFIRRFLSQHGLLVMVDAVK